MMRKGPGTVLQSRAENMRCHARHAAIFCFAMKVFRLSFLSSVAASLSLAQTELPWHLPDATARVVYRFSSACAVRDATVTVPTCESGGSVAYLDAEAPGAPLSVYAVSNGLALRLPGPLGPSHPRFVVAYRGGAASSPRLAGPLPPPADFASAVLGRAWDFEDGSQSGITSWGDRPHHLGPISVKDGWLQIPVKDTDPYFIFGDMFGPARSPRALAIDSAVYRFLELRVRQSCAQADWSFYVTDRDGRNKSLTFGVRGTGAQTFRFDLRAAFPDFWDGRLFRALRIDTTNGKKDLLAEVDYVRLLPEPPALTAGPLFTREAVAARAQVSGLRVDFPRTLAAGERGEASASAKALQPGARLLWALQTPEHGTVTLEGASRALPLPAFTRAGECPWSLGPADDLGQPLRAASGSVRVSPAALAAYRLTPAAAFLDLAAPVVKVTVEGLDRFGNALPVELKHPRWSLPDGAAVSGGRLSGAPAAVTLTCPAAAPATCRIALADGEGHAGEAAVTTVAYRKNPVRLNAAGRLVAADGSAVFPLGGLYANWPHRLNADGSLSRSLDLFPCGPSPYRAGFPWEPETEAAVAAYLKHCSERGVTCLRLMLRNMDLVGRADPEQLQATLHLFDLARPYGIRFNVALFEDYDKPPYVSRAILEKIVLPRYTPGQLAGLPPHRARFLVRKETLASAALRYSDPDALACQRDYLRELIPVLAAREEVLCYEYENEMVYPPMAWCRDTAAFLRSIDPHTLILGNPGPHDWPEPLRWREAGCDLFSYHPYNDGEPSADHGAIILLRSKFAAQSGLPFYTGEGGLNQNRWQKGAKQMGPQLAARGTRDQIWMSVCSGAIGCLYWTLGIDREAQEFASVKPALDALGLDLPTLKRQRPPVALALPPAARDRRDAALAMRLLDLGADFDTVTTNEAAAYAVRLVPGERTPDSLDLPATVARPAAGWQIATLVSDSGDRALLYLRNVAGGVKDFGAPPRPCHLRDVRPAEAAFALRGAWRSVTAFDLDARQARAAQPDASGRVTLGTTDHDFLIGLRR